MNRILSAFVAGAMLYSGTVTIPLFTEGQLPPEPLPVITPLYSVTLTVDNTVQIAYPLSAQYPPPDLRPTTVGAYRTNPERSFAAAIEAIQIVQSQVNEAWTANDVPGTPPNLWTQVEAQVVSAGVTESGNYILQRGISLGLTPALDPEFFASLNVLRNYQGLSSVTP